MSLAALAVQGVGAQEAPPAPRPPELPAVVVRPEGSGLFGVADSASEGGVGAASLAQRPLLRPAEVLETVPGMVVTQHSGDGKANQYFLRGFNLDHGTDFATTVAGVPVNQVSHAHGQGYMDLNFLVPELIAGIVYRKGPYAIEDGDFATAGAANIDYLRQLAAPLATVEAGPHQWRRGLFAASHGAWLAAIDVTGNDGPWTQPERLRKHNGVLRWSDGTRTNGIAVTAMAYEAAWTATEHVPERAIQAGEIGRFGALLPGDGGRTRRASLSAQWSRPTSGGQQTGALYVTGYGLNLFSNPSGFITGPAGDQHEQADRRLTWGGHWQRRFDLGAGWRDSQATFRIEGRQDRIGLLALYTTEARQRTGTVREDRVRQTALAWAVRLQTPWTGWLRTTLGLRQDHVQAQVTPLAGAFNADNGGRAAQTLTSPKFGLVLGPFARTELYLDAGQGLHSNDARGATARVNPADGTPADAVPLLVAARGAELGLRTVLLPGWESRLAWWQLRVGSELVFIGDAGVTEPKGSAKRHGVEWSNHWVVAAGLTVDADVAASKARFDQPVGEGGGRYVPNAIPLTASVGSTFDAGGRWFGGLRWRWLGAYALEDTNAERSRAFGMVNVRLGWRPKASLALSLDVLNLFDRQADDIAYWGAACTRREGTGCNGGAGVDGRLVHPLEPRTWRLALRMTL